jgi:hypothetical protein
MLLSVSAGLPVRHCNTTCLAACSGYEEDALVWGEDTPEAMRDVFGAKEEDICWATPVLGEHFTYFSSVLAGRMTHVWKLRQAGSAWRHVCELLLSPCVTVHITSSRQVGLKCC